MSSLWETRYRLVWEQLEEFAGGLSGAKPMVPVVLEERTVELLAGVLILLRQHHVNERGQCQFCGWTRWTWRLARRRRRCTVYVALDYALGQSFDVAWWKIFAELGREVSIEGVRRRNGEQREKDSTGRSAQGALRESHKQSQESVRGDHTGSQV